MKFSEMPYERVDLEKLKADFAALERDFDAAGSGEEQFRVHQRYYAVTGHAITEMTIAEIRHDIDMTDELSWTPRHVLPLQILSTIFSSLSSALV